MNDHLSLFDGLFVPATSVEIKMYFFSIKSPPSGDSRDPFSANEELHIEEYSRARSMVPPVSRIYNYVIPAVAAQRPPLFPLPPVQI